MTGVSDALIVLVEDDEDIRRLVRNLLAREGFAVEVADTSVALEQVLARKRPDLVILDLMLPGEDGLSICRKLRSSDAGVPILMLTAKSDPVDRVVGLEVGADDYVTKPFDPRELLARVRALLRRARHQPEPERSRRYAFDGLIIDLDTRSLANASGRADPRHQRRVRAAGLPRRAPAPRAHPRPAARLDPRPRRRPLRPHHRHDHLAAEEEDRGRGAGPQSHHHRPQQRLPVRSRRQAAAARMICHDPPMIGFGSTRLFIIFVTSLVALQLLAVLAFFVQRSRDTDTGLRMPLPDQAAALVELLEGTPKAQWPLLLRATSSTDLRVRVADTRPEAREPAWYEMPLVDFILRRYLASLGGREVRVRVEPSSELFAGPLKALAWVSPGAVEIEVGLRSGEYLIVATGGLLSLSALGFPPGFWAGVLGFAVAVITVLMVRREARPLRDLADAVDRMILPGKATALADVPRGAPEIRALIAAFNRLSQRIADLLKARMALVGGISHDLRTYATRLRLRAELIAEPDERAKAIHDLDDMQRLLDDSLLAIESGASRRAEELVDIAPILEREIEDRRRAGAAVSLSIAPAARSAQLIGDAPGAEAPDRQRHRQRAGLRRRGQALGRGRGRDADPHHRRQGPGHQRGRARHGVRAVRAAGGLAQSPHGRRGPRPRHRPQRGGGARRPHLARCQPRGRRPRHHRAAPVPRRRRHCCRSLMTVDRALQPAGDARRSPSPSAEDRELLGNASKRNAELTPGPREKDLPAGHCRATHTTGEYQRGRTCCPAGQRSL